MSKQPTAYASVLIPGNGVDFQNRAFRILTVDRMVGALVRQGWEVLSRTANGCVTVRRSEDNRTVAFFPPEVIHA